ncbi:MAG: DUF1780 domain-containing protein [Gallionella sp.]|nr:DUF1780 domain-containing protein [Gallionella sp.]
MDDRETHNHLLKSAWDDVEYFSNPNKEVRERWVVSEFLSILGIAHQENDLISLEQANKADVRFLSANFQVKELPNPNFKRGKMYKDVYNSIKDAKSLEDISWVSDVHEIPPAASMYELVLGKAAELSDIESYKALKGELDILIYVTRTRASLIQPSELNAGAFAKLGWRSVSCVNSKQAIVLFSSPSAPEFIKKCSQVFMR